MTQRTNPTDDYASFLMRVWRESAAAPDSIWCVQISSVQTGQSWHFATPAEFLEFFERFFPSGDDGDDGAEA